MLVLLEDSSEPVSQNPSFESPEGQWPTEWSRWIKWGIGSKQISEQAARTGRLGVVCRGMKRGGPHQTVEVTPGRYAAVAFVRIPHAPKGNATVTLSFTLLGPSGENLTDEDYAYRPGYPMPGRSWMLGLVLGFR
jgi:hypothetical protein